MGSLPCSIHTFTCQPARGPRPCTKPQRAALQLRSAARPASQLTHGGDGVVHAVAVGVPADEQDEQEVGHGGHDGAGHGDAGARGQFARQACGEGREAAGGEGEVEAAPLAHPRRGGRRSGHTPQRAVSASGRGAGGNRQGLGIV